MRHSLILFTALSIGPASAQLSNGGFESLDPDGNPEYWKGNEYIISIWIDSLGIGHADSIVFDGANYLLNTTDPHSGLNAAEIRNGFNYTQNEAIPGSWSASPFQVAYGGFPYPFVGVLARPSALHFWSKYTSVNMDSANAEIRAFDQNEVEVGSGSLVMAGPVVNYTYFEVPVSYTLPNDVAFVTVTFRASTPTGTANLGSRLLVDDVGLSYTSVSVEEAPFADGRIALAPNPASDALRIRLDPFGKISAVMIYDIAGREVLRSGPADLLDISSLDSGRYTVQVSTGVNAERASLIVTR